MVELGLYAATRIYWVVFSGVLLPYVSGIGVVLAVLGTATAAIGAAVCFAEHDLKRLLAFSVIAHAGIMLVGVALWKTGALAGVELYGLEQGLLHGGLFLAAGILLYRTGSLDECELSGRGRRMPWLGALFFLGAAGLAGLPPFATFWGDVLLDGAAARLGYTWVAWLVFLTEAVMAAAVVRFALGVFAGWGAPTAHDRPAPRGHAHAPFSMYAPPTLLVLLSAMAGLAPRLTGASESAAIYLEDRVGYAQRVLDLLTPYPPTVSDAPATGPDLVRSLATAAVAQLLSCLSLSPQVRGMLPRGLPGAGYPSILSHSPFGRHLR
jgi:multicomponent Na+:H+ antiporter subunit D